MKVCKTCKVEKMLDQFYSSSRRPGHIYVFAECKACCYVRTAARRDVEKQKKHSQAHDLRRKLRLNIRRDALLLTQGGVCAVCGTDSPGSAYWHLDHDHSCCSGNSKQACGNCDRGVLCSNCNTRVVAGIESPHFEAALAYLGRAA